MAITAITAITDEILEFIDSTPYKTTVYKHLKEVAKDYLDGNLDVTCTEEGKKRAEEIYRICVEKLSF